MSVQADEIILKISTFSKDVELCMNDGMDNIRYKALSKQNLLDIVERFAEPRDVMKKNITMFNNEIIGMDANHVLIKQSEQKKIVLLQCTGDETPQSYKISSPNMLYILSHNKDKVNSVEAYAYKEYKGLDTELFENPMPNELNGNKICIGSNNYKIHNNNYVSALESVIFATYTHSNFSGVNGFSNSKKWFKFLSDNKFPYKLLKPLNRKLKDVLEG